MSPTQNGVKKVAASFQGNVIRPRRPGGASRDSISRRADGHLEWSPPLAVWLGAGVMAVLLVGGIAALAEPLDACTRSRVQAPHLIAGKTRHAADVAIDRAR